MNLYEMLRSKVRRKIMRYLWKVGCTNIMNLVRKVNSTYNQVIPHLIAFEKEGIVSEQRFGRVRMITLERENQKTKLLLEALKILDKEFAPCIPYTNRVKQQIEEKEVVHTASDVVSPLFHRVRQKETKG